MLEHTHLSIDRSARSRTLPFVPRHLSRELYTKAQGSFCFQAPIRRLGSTITDGEQSKNTGRSCTADGSLDSDRGRRILMGRSFPLAPSGASAHRPEPAQIGHSSDFTGQAFYPPA